MGHHVLDEVVEARRHWQYPRKANGQFALVSNLLVSGDDVFIKPSPESAARLLAAANVTHINTCHGGAPQIPLAFQGCERLCLTMEDLPHYPILRHFSTVLRFLARVDPGNRCLIHCRLGINRSVALAMAAMIHLKVRSIRKNQHGSGTPDFGKVFSEAWQEITKGRGMHVLANPGFQRQLLMYAYLLSWGPAADGHKREWPDRWGPELWMPLDPAAAARLENGSVERLCQVRRTLEKAGESSGKILLAK